jgi:hypothetical protein
MKPIDNINYLDCIKKALPDAQIEGIDNYDDINFGYNISPIPGTLIRFEINMQNQMCIHISRFIIETWTPTVHFYKMYGGHIPADENMEPDFRFIEQVLRNYNNIG